MSISMKGYSKVVYKMRDKIIIFIIFLTCTLLSCKKSQFTQNVYATPAELLQDAQKKQAFKNKYKNKNVFITGKVLYIGVPKDTTSKFNTTYITIVEDEKTAALVYFDFFVNQNIQVDQIVQVKCILKSFSKPTPWYNKNFIVFKNGELIKTF